MASNNNNNNNTTMAQPTLYFGFGSNMSLSQMKQRCPSSPFTGIAHLTNWRWQINTRGYANIVKTNDPSDEVWGMIYALTPEDEATLDLYEHVPDAYQKDTLAIDKYWPAPADETNTDEAPDSSEEAILQRRVAAVESREKQPQTAVQMLVYVDHERVEDGDPWEDYVHRLYNGVKDALDKGVPKEYIEKVKRVFRPDLQ